MKPVRPLILTLALLAAGCGAVQPSANLSSTSKTNLKGAMVVDSHLGGDRTAVIDFGTAADGGFKTQSIVHRWVASDISEFDVTLSAGGKDLLTVPVLLKNDQPEVVFNHLQLNTTYTVSVVAKGSNQYVNGGTTQVINSQTPATGSILFSGSNDVENTKSLSINVQLDSTVFDGSATTSVTTTDGSFLTPSATESGAAVALPLKITTTVAINAWGWDIISTGVSHLDMSPILCSDGQLHTPNTFSAVPLNGTLNLSTIHASYASWFDASTGSGTFQWWMYTGQWAQYGVTKVGVKSHYDDGHGVTGDSAIQGTANF